MHAIMGSYPTVNFRQLRSIGVERGGFLASDYVLLLAIIATTMCQTLH